ncbi:phosphatase PAP2 family protein [Candidatus Saccharibacteria bacterium]|nr:phosphatase PAP2 family protein [Candidatus Saccharibacteria bacterium]
MEWEKATDVILISALAVFAIFVWLGIFQWIRRKSFLKIDKNLLWALLPLILMSLVYFLFDKVFVLNVRPNGSGEPSFPSTHVMVVATIFFMVAINLKKYIANVYIRFFLYTIMLVLIALVSYGRVIANMHWISDVLGGLGFAAIFAVIYYFVTRKAFKNE